MNKQEKIHKVMREFKYGKLSDSHGNKVTNRDQAVAIAMSEADRYKKASIELRSKYLTTPQQKIASNSFYDVPKYVDFETWKQLDEIKHSKKEVRDKLETKFANKNTTYYEKMKKIIDNPFIKNVAAGVATGVSTNLVLKAIDGTFSKPPQHTPLVILLNNKHREEDNIENNEDVDDKKIKNKVANYTNYTEYKPPLREAIKNKLKNLKHNSKVLLVRMPNTMLKKVYSKAYRAVDKMNEFTDVQGLSNF